MLGPEKSWVFLALMEMRIKDSNNSSGANTALSPYTLHIEGQGEKRLLVGLLPRFDVPGCCPQPSQKLFKRSNQITPGWIYPIFCLQHPPPARSPDRLSVCAAINELPGRALATLGLCEGLGSKRGLISNKYWFVCKWNSSVYGMVLDTQVVTKLLWGQMLSRTLIRHLNERQQSRSSEDFCRILHLGHCEEGQRQVYAIYSSSRPRFSPFLNTLKCSG